MTLRRLLFAGACVLTLVAMFYTEENWRGLRAWRECRRELEAQGMNLDWSARIPNAVPDEQNVFRAPHMNEWFVKGQPGPTTNSGSLSTGALAVVECSQARNGRLLAEVTTMPATVSVTARDADLVLHYQASPAAALSSSELEALGRAFQHAYESAGVNGPSLQSVQDPNRVFVAAPINPPLRVVLQADANLKAAEVRALFEAAIRQTDSASGARVRIEPEGTRQFHVFSPDINSVRAEDYLACSGKLTPVLTQIRQALDRPYARLNIDNSPPWGGPIPNFVNIRTIVQLLAQRAQCYLLLNQPEKALEELTLLYKVRRLLEAKPVTLVAAMIDVAITGLHSGIVAEGLRLHAWQEPQLKALQEQFQAVQLVSSLREAIDTERAASCALFERTPAYEFDHIFAFGDKLGFWSRFRDRTYLMSRTMPRGWVYQNLKALALQDQWFLTAISTNDVVKPGQVEELGRKSFAELERRSPFTVLARIAMPNYLKAFRNTLRNQATVNEAYLACALERFRLVHKEVPSDLDKLMPECAEYLPLDPVNGSALKYRLLETNQYLLYSIGWNESDDGGRPGGSTTEGDWVWDDSKPY